MKVYLAAKYSMKEDMQHVAAIFKSKGIGITSSWLNEPHSPSSTLADVDVKHLRKFALQDIEDIKAADAVVLFSIDPLIPTVRGGRHVETGIAIALGKPLFIIGPEENVFHFLPQVTHFTTISALLSTLAE
jgi:nucleoside 2-deoxyribosyltransferase